MADVTSRERDFAAALDIELLAIEQRNLSTEEHTAANRELIAHTLAAYRETLIDQSITPFSVKLSQDGKRAEFNFWCWHAMVAPGKALEMAIALQHIAATARGNGG